MGWSDCGTDSKGRPIGYAFPAWCDEENCTAKIDRGLSYACGEMHGETGIDCEGYFCSRHLSGIVVTQDQTRRVCGTCAKLLLTEICDNGKPDWIKNEDGAIVPADPALRRKENP